MASSGIINIQKNEITGDKTYTYFQNSSNVGKEDLRITCEPSGKVYLQFCYENYYYKRRCHLNYKYKFDDEPTQEMKYNTDSEKSYANGLALIKKIIKHDKLVIQEYETTPVFDIKDVRNKIKQFSHQCPIDNSPVDGKVNCNISGEIVANNTTMLSENNHFTLLEKGNVFGSNGNEIVKIAGTPNANIDSNVERIDFSRNLDFYTFSLTGNILTVSNIYGVVAKITTSDRLLKLAFKDGSVNFNLTGLDNGVFSEGALTLSNNFDITNIKAILNTNDSSDSTLVNIGSIVSQCAQ